MGLSFPKKVGLEPVSSYGGRIFCVGNLVGQDDDLGSAQNKGFFLANRCFREENEEHNKHSLIHCPKI